MLNMKVVGSVIARLGSKRLTYKNLLPYKGVPLVLRAVKFLELCPIVDQVVLSTDSELIARTCMESKAEILLRPDELAEDDVASIPVFHHIIEHFSCDVHVNYNCNFPECSPEVVAKAVALANDTGEALSVPYAIWAQTRERIFNYGNPFEINATRFEDDRIHPLDVHHMEDLLAVHRAHQPDLPDEWSRTIEKKE
ncbi:MAG: hypothetical protein CMI26_08530 [Opitutae bacterium]|jgi:CMP-2-keto-3-deoxyoctulosonic acid synthetase|nr:hypothetical protein [Opitutae bacterium]|tara:strand:+ start:2531 stop:3118 length:588 start_codon:yes stop_codon:yes gene_type:complete